MEDVEVVASQCCEDNSIDMNNYHLRRYRGKWLEGNRNVRSYCMLKDFFLIYINILRTSNRVVLSFAFLAFN